jgi:tetratricopeptide (TPR) repeat protein
MPERLHGDFPFILEALDGDDFRWKQLTERGNRAFASGDHQNALADYDAALLEAQRLFALARRGASLEAAPILVISCHNAAENWLQLGDSSKALAFYRLAYEGIVTAAETTSAPRPFRSACICNLSHAMTPLIALLRNSGAANSDIAAIVARARRVASDPANLPHDVTRH